MLFIMAGMAWLMWPGKAHALSLGCELPGAETEQHWYPDVERCVELKCDRYHFSKGPMYICDEELAWFTAELVGCTNYMGQCIPHYGPPDWDCQEPGDDEDGSFPGYGFVW